jgi:hypothetical protein
MSSSPSRSCNSSCCDGISDPLPGIRVTRWVEVLFPLWVLLFGLDTLVESFRGGRAPGGRQIESRVTQAGNSPKEWKMNCIGNQANVKRAMLPGRRKNVSGQVPACNSLAGILSD